MSKFTSNQRFHHVLKQSNVAESVGASRKKGQTFRSVSIQGASAAPDGGTLTANTATLYFGLFGEGRKVLSDQIANDDLAPRSFAIPDGLPEARIEDLHVYGTATDGAWIEFFSEKPL
jgi:hypothetical protein